MTAQTTKMPYGVGKFSGGWAVLLFILLAMTGFGIYAYSQQLIHGEVVTGMRDIGTSGGAPWGMYIAFVIYFEGVSFAGIGLAAVIRLFKIDHLKPVARMAVMLTVVSLMLAGLGVIADVGQPGRALVNLLKYARPGSPFFGTFTVAITGFLIGALVYTYLDGRRDAALMAKNNDKYQGFYRRWAAGYQDTRAERARHDKASFWLAIALLPLLVVAHTTLGFVFGLQVGRPGWFGTLQAPGFLALAGVSGIGHLIILAAVLRKVLNQEEKVGMDIFQWLGKALMWLTGAYLYFMVVEWLTSTYSAQATEVQLRYALLQGEYAWIFWASVAGLVIPFVLLAWQFVTKRYSLGLLVLSGLLVNLAAIGKRYLVVVPSQTHGLLMPYSPGSYAPTWVEYGVIVGLMGLGALVFVLFMKVFPIMEVIPEEQELRSV
jgi:molybdopterin-containing oxidoreductase family membrane subunit